VVTFRYHESLVMVRKVGVERRRALATQPSRAPGEKPAGTIAQQITVTVTIVEIDLKVPSITVKTDAGQVVSRRVQDPKKLEGVKAGDRIEITYTEALAISVTSK
jgi:Cu/Ag efflux protein CusF